MEAVRDRKSAQKLGKKEVKSETGEQLATGLRL
jgi:hypothetical protein